DSDLLLSKPAPKAAAKPKPASSDTDLLLNKLAPKVASAAPRPSAPAAPSSAAPGGAGSLFGSLPTISATPQPNTQTASATPPAAAGTEGMNKQGVILFAHDADSPAA